jgi:hypothetical protein
MTTGCAPCQARVIAAAAVHQAGSAVRSSPARQWVMTGRANPVEITGADLSQLFPQGVSKSTLVVAIPAGVVLLVKLLGAAWAGALVAGIATVPVVWFALYNPKLGSGVMPP